MPLMKQSSGKCYLFLDSSQLSDTLISPIQVTNNKESSGQVFAMLLGM